MDSLTPISASAGELKDENSCCRGFGEEIAEFPTNLELYMSLECPVCNEIPLPPIYNCVTGHILCNVCRESLKKCAICNADFTQSRNFFMENVIMLCKFYCHYKNHGCQEKISGESLKHHVENCLYKNGPLNDKNKQSLNTNTPWCFYWIDINASGVLPSNCVCGGFEDGYPFYVVRKFLPNKALVPGKFIANSNLAAFFWENKIYVTKTFEVLTATSDALDWVLFQDGNEVIPTHAVIGGKSDLGEILYIGRRGYEGKMCVGYVLGKKFIFVIDRTNHEITPPFEILVKSKKGILLENSSNY